MAKEYMNFTRYNILMKASEAILMQANNMQQGILQILQDRL